MRSAGRRGAPARQKPACWPVGEGARATRRSCKISHVGQGFAGRVNSNESCGIQSMYQVVGRQARWLR